jgi:peptidoglycan-associated lipoprotein
MRKNMWLALTLALTLAAMSFIVSCATETVQNQPDQTVPSQGADAVKTPAGQAVAPQDDRLQAETAGSQAAGAAFIDEKIYFAFDSALLSEQARQILHHTADYLNTNPDIRVTVEGHCDMRGTDAYNMALGERRAEAAKDFLVDLGITGQRLATVSFGEERPIASGHDEASWAMNRRAQFVITRFVIN